MTLRIDDPGVSALDLFLALDPAGAKSGYLLDMTMLFDIWCGRLLLYQI